MRSRIAIVIILLSHSGILKAQSILLDRVYSYVEDKNYEKALEEIGNAENNASTATDPKTYYLKSFVYKDLYLEANVENADSLLSIGIQSLNKAKSLDKASTYAIQLNQLEKFFYSSYYNQGVLQFNFQKFDEAIISFNKFLDHTTSINPYWLDANYYCGVSNLVEGNNKKAIELFSMLANNDYQQPLLYADLATLFMDENNEEKASSFIKKGLIMYPDDTDIQLVHLNVLSQFGHYVELQAQLETMLLSDPNNIELFLMLGTVYGKNKNNENSTEYSNKIEQTYTKIIKIDPEHFEGNFNLGVHYYNMAVEIINKNDYDISLVELSEILSKSAELFQKALPFLQTNNQKLKTIKLLKALQAIYYNLNMIEELQEITKELESLTQ